MSDGITAGDEYGAHFLHIDCGELDGAVSLSVSANLNPSQALAVAIAVVDIAAKITMRCPCPDCATNLVALNTASIAIAPVAGHA